MSNGMSKREKSLVAVALTLLLGVGYYGAVYQPLSDKLDTKRQEKKDEDLKYQKAQDDIKNLENNKAELKKLFGQTTVKSSKFYPEIIQEQLILELQNMITASGLTVKSTVWTEEKTQPVEKFTPEDSQTTGVTLDKSAEQYRSKSSSDSKDSSTKSNNNNSNNTNNSASTNTASSDSAACQSISCTINVNSSYDSVKKFIQEIEASGRNISITNTTLSPINDATVNGSLVLEFYGLPKIDDSDDGYSNWSYNNDVQYGKDQLFGKGAATGAYSDSTSDATSEADDFIALLKSSTSELPIVSLGKADDNTFQSYLYGNDENSKKVTIEFNEKEGKLYYSYKVGNASYPKDSDGVEFMPKGTDIQIGIQSEERTDSSDNGEIELEVINNTTKDVNVVITGDDKEDPRVPSPSSSGSGTVNWLNK